jgi:hypothetical protein
MTARLRGALREVNDMLSSIKIEVDGVAWRGRRMVFTGAGGAQSFILPVPGNPLRRIFARGSFKLGGRAYGWYQNIPKEWRKRITINGSATAELDFRAMHLSMLYNEANTLMPAGDPYAIPGWQRGRRQACREYRAQCRDDAGRNCCAQPGRGLLSAERQDESRRGHSRGARHA